MADLAPIHRASFATPSPSSSQELDVPATAKNTQKQIGNLINLLHTVTKSSPGPSASSDPSTLNELAESIKSLNQLAKHILGQSSC